MPDEPAALDHMLAAWNERDPALVRGHLERALSPSVRFVDPTVDLTGIDAFEANVRHVHTQIPGAVYSRTSEVDAQHGFVRYHWAIDLDGARLVDGFDVTEVDGDGLVVQVIGFFGLLAST